MATRVRRRRSREDWERLVASYEAGDQTREAFCTEHGISGSSLSYWRGKLREEPGFIELATPKLGGWEIELGLGEGVVLRLRRG